MAYNKRREWDRLLMEKLAKDKEFKQKKEQTRRADMEQKKQLYYAGIGSRSTPGYILDLMEQLACVLREEGFILRSGHAEGADQAFERGAGAAAQIFLPWPSFNQDVEFSASRDPDTGVVTHPVIVESPDPQAEFLVMSVHPAWATLTQGSRKLHMRNAHQIFGPRLATPTPVEFVVCWTPDGQEVGGTRTAIELAKEQDIAVWNLAHEETYDMAFEWAWGDGATSA